MSIARTSSRTPSTASKPGPANPPAPSGTFVAPRADELAAFLDGVLVEQPRR
ncbi:hypothetical protein WIS52_14735 [Pseudonocardia nematodicida]|uniref:Uncharacterized protein n=1 Tax=Pseudonocardia nematodicida TaxID=1206997 RepID=A0ABV1KB76_9PSEU